MNVLNVSMVFTLERSRIVDVWQQQVIEDHFIASSKLICCWFIQVTMSINQRQTGKKKTNAHIENVKTRARERHFRMNSTNLGNREKLQRHLLEENKLKPTDRHDCCLFVVRRTLIYRWKHIHLIFFHKVHSTQETWSFIDQTLEKGFVWNWPPYRKLLTSSSCLPERYEASNLAFYLLFKSRPSRVHGFLSKRQAM